MDRNTELLLQKAGRPENWKDEEKASNDLQSMREEFRNRLYANAADRSLRAESAGIVTNGSFPAPNH